MFPILLILFSVLAIVASGVVFKGIRIVPHRHVWIVQRLGKFHRILEPGLNWIVPFVDVIAYRHSIKEEIINIHAQTAITKDNVSVSLDGILYVKIIDPFAASYGVKDPYFAIEQLVQTTIRSEIGKLLLDRTFEERESLNVQIVSTISEASKAWGIKCIRYEIKDINMPDEIRKAMELQMIAERQKRARILESEGVRQAQINESEGRRQADINLAEGKKQSIVLESEAAKIDQINRAKGKAESIYDIALATKKQIQILAESVDDVKSEKAVAYLIAENYIKAFKELAKESTTLMLPLDPMNGASMIAQATSIYQTISKEKTKNDKAKLIKKMIDADKK
ncbi:MAG: paraslipin [Chlamydiae bacterium]|nr:paraslipin [Chlamydiota bacterium]